MKIILVESVNHLGRSGEVVTVKPGFARNYLIPKGFAMVANKENMAVLEEKQAEISAKEEANRNAAVILQAELEALSLEIKVETNDEGELFGSIGVNEVAKILVEKGQSINKRDIVLPQGQITQLGQFPVNVICHVDVIANLTINVV